MLCEFLVPFVPPLSKGDEVEVKSITANRKTTTKKKKAPLVFSFTLLWSISWLRTSCLRRLRGS